jgi:TP53 regulating kinase-like protein
VRAAKGGVNVPKVLGMDLEGGVVGMEWIEGGWSLREVLGAGEEDDGMDEDGEEEDEEKQEDEEETPKGWEGLNLCKLFLVA